MKNPLKLMTILIALALTACGSPAQSSKGGASSGGNPSSAHQHVAAEGAAWQSDDEYHWKDCKDNDGGKAEKGAHQWVSDTSKQDVSATCSTVGKKYEKCSVCGKERVVDLPTTDHEWEKQKDNEMFRNFETNYYLCTDEIKTKWQKKTRMPEVKKTSRHRGLAYGRRNMLKD